MGRLFKDKIIKTKLEKFEIPDFESKLEIIKNWHKALHSGILHQKTETQCEQSFNQDFFIQILGYTTFPNTEYTIEPKGKTETSAQKPDAVLGVFKEGKQRVLAVCEIKDSRTSLDRVQRRKDNLSPVQQGFKYKPQYQDCRFVIVTNFSEIRLYKDTMLDFEAFTLDGLLNSKNDYYQFRKFYYLLCCENFISKRGPSKTESLISEIIIEQEHITKAFYEEYRALRLELILNIHKNCPQRPLFHIIEKAQKLIDRVVFVCFCEDIDLLPENKLKEVVEYAKNSSLTRPIWKVMISFFEAIDKGSDKLGVPDGYNGELYKDDPELNTLIIDDEVCEKFVDLGRYDFSEDLSVNILGHIFEQSITDLEDLKKEHSLEGIQQVSKRKKDGIFYTPEHIVAYIVDNSVGNYLRKKESEFINQYGLKEGIKDKTYETRQLKAYQAYQEILRNIKVLDPACGSGAFLVKVFDYLLSENIRVSEILTELREGHTSLFDTTIYIKEILQNNIYGVDLNQESVEITKLSLWLQTAQKGKKLTVLKNNIKCGDSLINNQNLVGDKAFNWEIEFKEIINKEGFDCVIGNPPYEVLSEKETGLTNAKEIVEYFKNDSVLMNSAQGKTNLYKVFICKALSLIKEGGYFSFIVPMALLGDMQTIPVRKYLLNNSTFEFIECFPQKDNAKKRVFEEAKIATTIFCVKKGSSNKAFPVRTHPGKYIEDDTDNILLVTKPEIENFDKENMIIPTCNKKDWEIIKKIINKPYFVHLGECATQFQGEVNETIEAGKGCLAENQTCPPILRGANITMYAVREASQGKVLFLDDIRYLDGKKAGTKAFHHQLRRIGFQRSSPQNNFRRIIAAPIKAGLYCFDTVSYITEDSTSIDLDVLLLLLNSNLYDWYFRATSTNSKVNEYQFNNLPFFETMESKEDVSALIKDKRFSELILKVKNFYKEYKKPPSWTFDVLKNISIQIQHIENQRELKSRRERSSLDESSQGLQRYANILISSVFELILDDYDYIESRLQNML